MSLRTLRAGAALIVTTALLSACVSQNTYDQQVTKANTYQQLDTQLKGEIPADPAQITQLQGLVRVTLAMSILFPEGGWQLDARGKATLTKLAPVLRPSLARRSRDQGLPDNVRSALTRQRFPTDVDLFKARAQSVATSWSPRRAGVDDHGDGLGRRRSGGAERHAPGSGQEPPCRDGYRRSEVTIDPPTRS